MVQIDMEMPQDCDHCHFGYEDYITKKSGCDLMDCLPNSPDCSACTPMGQRDKNCPLREVPKGKCIPCSERLPEYNETVLTWDGNAFCVEKRIPYIRDDDGEPIEGDWWVGDEYDEYESDYYPNLRDGAAIAWMPLPAPYTEDDNG